MNTITTDNNFQKDCMIVINCWAATLAQQKLLTDCIFNLSLLKLDICLVSHNPISSALQSCVDYFIYDSENPLITGTKNSNWWYGNSQIHINLIHLCICFHYQYLFQLLLI